MGNPGFQELLLVTIVLVPFILSIWAILDIVKSSFRESTNKIVWLLVVLFLPLLGVILYFAIGRSQRVA
ncbi:hypothetical protein FC093_11100 [Ilyomonas limi]|uniref:Cardiolipin synthase N-terminal domain-containing protein n=1 Tax=Ilyomonas limi TaxID=2575867 RepID=A0A4U3L104_9BACT|nr:PLDc N-terminal domain-containing protein [Ilyomonas limi]TKK68655.1 hypothetical protein FC093_11100 [Ilyomonas limi]